MQINDSIKKYIVFDKCKINNNQKWIHKLLINA